MKLKMLFCALAILSTPFCVAMNDDSSVVVSDPSESDSLDRAELVIKGEELLIFLLRNTGLHLPTVLAYASRNDVEKIKTDIQNSITSYIEQLPAETFCSVEAAVQYLGLKWTAPKTLEQTQGTPTQASSLVIDTSILQKKNHDDDTDELAQNVGKMSLNPDQPITISLKERITKKGLLSLAMVLNSIIASAIDDFYANPSSNSVPNIHLVYDPTTHELVITKTRDENTRSPLALVSVIAGTAITGMSITAGGVGAFEPESKCKTYTIRGLVVAMCALFVVSVIIQIYEAVQAPNSSTQPTCICNCSYPN